jgi:hypothetical protein
MLCIGLECVAPFLLLYALCCCTFHFATFTHILTVVHHVCACRYTKNGLLRQGLKTFDRLNKKLVGWPQKSLGSKAHRQSRTSGHSDVWLLMMTMCKHSQGTSSGNCSVLEENKHCVLVVFSHGLACFHPSHRFFCVTSPHPTPKLYLLP